MVTPSLTSVSLVKWEKSSRLQHVGMYVKLVAQDLVELIVLPGQNEQC